MTVIEFFVPSRPIPGGSKRKGKAGQIIAANPKTAAWMSVVRVAAIDAYKGDLLDGPLGFQMTFCLKRPKNHFNAKGQLKPNAPKFPIVIPDLTKMIRSTEDALTGICWHDDCQVVHQITKKLYCFSEAEGAEIKIWEVLD